MLKYVSKRFGLALIAVVIALTITFFLLRMLNRTPEAITAEITKLATSSPKADPSKITAEVYSKYDYHPEWSSMKSYWHYVGGVLRGDFGYYFAKPEKSIFAHFATPLKYTFLVSGIGFVLGSLLGMFFGIIAGYKRGQWPDIALNIFAVVFVAIPSFVLASILIVTANKTNWPTQFLSPEMAGGFAPMFKTLIIPIAIVTVTSFASITYYVRNEVVEVLKSDYVATARSKGLPERKVFFKHVLRNVSIPAVTIILPRFILVIMGSLIIELFFGVPGAASMIQTAITKTEYNVILFSILFFSTLTLMINILVDVLYTILDPRIKFASKNDFSLFKKIKNAYIRRKKSISLAKIEGGKND